MVFIKSTRFNTRPCQENMIRSCAVCCGKKSSLPFHGDDGRRRNVLALRERRGLPAADVVDLGCLIGKLEEGC